jgi:threonine/homoserine/homoserine lactone efflux protein
MDIFLHLGGGFVLGACAAISPGPDTVLVLRSSASGGARAGIRAALGIGAGLTVHAAAAAVLIAVVSEVSGSPVLKVIQAAGAVYLAYLGYCLLRATAAHGQDVAGPHAAGPAAPTKFFCQGFLTNLTNPKAIVFFASVVSPFLAARDAGSALAVITGVVAAVPVWFIVLSVCSGRLLRHVTADHRRLIDGVSGGLFVAVAAYSIAMCWIA